MHGAEKENPTDPEGPSPMYPTWHQHLSTNWPVFYFEPIAKYFAA
jgi:hypothetical protein